MAKPTLQGDVQLGAVDMGQNGRKFAWGSFAFVATAATADIPVQLTQIEAIFIQKLGSSNSDERIYGPTIGGTGLKTVPSSGLITITREGTLTSALECSYLIIGK